jgi:hypothetical protein
MKFNNLSPKYVIEFISLESAKSEESAAEQLIAVQYLHVLGIIQSPSSGESGECGDSGDSGRKGFPRNSSIRAERIPIEIESIKSFST